MVQTVCLNDGLLMYSKITQALALKSCFRNVSLLPNTGNIRDIIVYVDSLFSKNNKQAQESLGSCDELLSTKLFNLDGTIKKQHMHIMSKTFVFF